jgi:hypothetical protein
VHWKIGSAPVGGIIEVVEFDEAGDLAWVSITGVNLPRTASGCATPGRTAPG